MVEPRKVLLISSINLDKSPTGGVEARSQVLFKYLKSKKEIKLDFIDVSPNVRNYYTYFLLLIKIVKYRRIIISVSFTGLKLLTFLLRFFDKKSITIFIAGGEIEQYTKNSKLLKLIEKASLVYVQSKSMVHYVKKVSNKVNVHNLGNFKNLPLYKAKYKTNKAEVIKLVFLSRVHRDKGIFRAIDTITYLNKNYNDKKFVLDIYGPIDLTDSDLKQFNVELKDDRINYKGYLKLNESDGYSKLSKYHFFVFLTTHPGEGFPGVLIDALYSKTHIIASDWKYNNEIVPSRGLLVDLESNDYQTQIFYYIKSVLEKEEVDYQSELDSFKKESYKYEINSIEFKIA